MSDGLDHFEGRSWTGWHHHAALAAAAHVFLTRLRLTDKRPRRDVFTSVADLTQAITRWAEHWNTDPKLFIWKATADDVIEKVSRSCANLHRIKSQTDH